MFILKLIALILTPFVILGIPILYYKHKDKLNQRTIENIIENHREVIK